jgi:hypothetical protein
LDLATYIAFNDTVSTEGVNIEGGEAGLRNIECFFGKLDKLNNTFKTNPF